MMVNFFNAVSHSYVLSCFLIQYSAQKDTNPAFQKHFLRLPIPMLSKRIETFVSREKNSVERHLCFLLFERVSRPTSLRRICVVLLMETLRSPIASPGGIRSGAFEAGARNLGSGRTSPAYLSEKISGKINFRNKKYKILGTPKNSSGPKIYGT